MSRTVKGKLNGAADFPAMPGLDFNKPAAEQIFDALRTAILLADLEPGRLISENEVGQIFGASRTPVREAFAHLRSDGLIVTRPSRGTFVSKLSERQIRSVQFIREALEIATVNRLCELDISEESDREIRETLAAQERALNDRDPIAFQTHDDNFHAALAEATGFDRINDLLMREKIALDRLRVLSLHDMGHKSELYKEHRAIYQAIRNKDIKAAASYMQHHLRRVLATLSDLRDEHQPYFE